MFLILASSVVTICVKKLELSGIGHKEMPWKCWRKIKSQKNDRTLSTLHHLFKHISDQRAQVLFIINDIYKAQVPNFIKNVIIYAYSISVARTISRIDLKKVKGHGNQQCLRLRVPHGQK